MFCEMEADQESNSRTSDGLKDISKLRKIEALTAAVLITASGLQGEQPLVDGKAREVGKMDP